MAKNTITKWNMPDKTNYASRSPGELHDPFKTNAKCIALEMLYPCQAKN